MTRRLALLLVLGAALAATGLAAPAAAQDDESAVRDRRFDCRFILGAGEWAELNMQMEEGGGIAYRINSADDRQIYMDLHSHEGNDVIYHFRTNDTGISSQFTAPAAGGYSFLLERMDLLDANVHVNVQGDFGIESQENMPCRAEGPGPALALLLVALLAVAAIVARHRRA